jgi:hypothetical protein
MAAASNCEVQQSGARVYISLTTIPSRASLLSLTIESLMKQDYANVGAIVVTVPTVNVRGLPFKEEADFSWLTALTAAHPDAAPVVIQRPAFDYGPIMKYIGASMYLGQHPDLQAWVFVCDDDQQYATDRVSVLMSQVPCVRGTLSLKHFVAVPTNYVFHVFMKSFFAPMGVYGMVMSYAGIMAIADETQAQFSSGSQGLCKSCIMNDDVSVGVFLWKKGFRVVSDRVGANHARVFATKKLAFGADALADTYASNFHKFNDMMRCSCTLEPYRCWGALVFVLIILLILVSIALLIYLVARPLRVSAATTSANADGGATQRL